MNFLLSNIVFMTTNQNYPVFIDGIIYPSYYEEGTITKKDEYWVIYL